MMFLESKSVATPPDFSHPQNFEPKHFLVSLFDLYVYKYKQSAKLKLGHPLFFFSNRPFQYADR